MEKYVLDSFAILCYLNQEQDSKRVKQLLVDAKNDKNKVYLNWINLGEVYYIIARNINKKKAIESINLLKYLPIQFLECAPELILKAAEIKSQYAMSYADCFVVATALEENAIIVTGDNEFKSIEKLLPILWINK
ncbi:MAG: type II toxin-antitoxin system VapC family toxin [Calditrichia bacterium]|nr:type II toxin-antitoxin system VapC family toxin [Calditrichia bacterium]